MIISCEVILAGALSLKLTALRFVNVPEEVLIVTVENSISMTTNDVTEFAEHFSKEVCEVCTD